ncbi:hypothetical protein [Mycobacterium sp. Root135]|uniref:hypothetical protein n=1 Tax=Mycobacterium sp. Root135 TaxID=1736457 RepID=UPI000A4A8774|nr:hypothetical protein [Mycobacterium sp. Root135]
MNTIARSLVTATFVGAAALGLAGVASPGTYATPAPTVGPGWYGNHGPAYIAHLNGK